MSSVFDYIFNVGGNFTAQISGMSAATAGEMARMMNVMAAGQAVRITMITGVTAKTRI